MHIGSTQGLQFFAFGVQTAGNFGAQIAWHQRRRSLYRQIVQVVLALMPDLDHVLEALIRQQTGAGASPLNQCIGEKGGRMHHPFDIQRIDAACPHELLHTLRNALGRVSMGGQHLQAVKLPGCIVKRNHVGKGATYVNSNCPICHTFLLMTPPSRHNGLTSRSSKGSASRKV